MTRQFVIWFWCLWGKATGHSICFWESHSVPDPFSSECLAVAVMLRSHRVSEQASAVWVDVLSKVLNSVCSALPLSVVLKSLIAHVEFPCVVSLLFVPGMCSIQSSLPWITFFFERGQKRSLGSMSVSDISVAFFPFLFLAPFLFCFLFRHYLIVVSSYPNGPVCVLFEI